MVKIENPEKYPEDVMEAIVVISQWLGDSNHSSDIERVVISEQATIGLTFGQIAEQRRANQEAANTIYLLRRTVTAGDYLAKTVELNRHKSVSYECVAEAARNFNQVYGLLGGGNDGR